MPKKKNAVRADGRISVQVYLGRGDDGRRKYKTVYGANQKEADAKAEQVKLAMRKGIDVTAEMDTFGEWAEQWMKIKATEVSKSQVVVYKSRTDWINGYIAEAQISKIKTIILQKMIYDLAENNPNTGKPASRRTLEVTKNTLVQVFRLAIENRVMDYNPAVAIKLPKNAPEQKRRALTEDEQEWILSTAHRARRAAMVMMYAGLRRGELIPLTWNDINLKDRTISVNKAVEVVGGEFVTKTSTKTGAGLRVVDIPQRLADFLDAEARTSIYVCHNAKDSFHTVSSWRQMWSSYLAELNIKNGNFSKYETIGKNGKSREIKSKYDPKGAPLVIPKITPHWLRHTFATMLYLAGVDVLTARDQLGHADIKTTLEIYTHLDKQYKRKSMNRLDEYLGDASHMQVKEKSQPLQQLN